MLCAAKKACQGTAFGGGQEPVAVAEALHTEEKPELRLPCLLYLFGFGRRAYWLRPPAGLVQGIRCRGATSRSPERIAALVGVNDRLAGIV